MHDEQLVQTNYHHDADGNLLQDDKWTYEWNAENRLIAMESMDKAIPQRLEFRYDPQGRRIQKTIYESNTDNVKKKKNPKWHITKQYHYVYDGWNLNAELDDKGDLIRTHLWGIDISGSLQGAGGVGGHLKTTEYEEYAMGIPLYNGNGNIVQYMDPTHADVHAKMSYDPFGNTPKDPVIPGSGLPFRFSTKFTDDETGLIYYGFRYYDSEKGRWLNRDPLVEMGGINVVCIVGNDLLNDYDFLGFSGSGNASKLFGLALGTVLPMYRASLSVCWKKLNTCEAGCGLVSSYTATIVSGAYATCMAANAVNPLGWIACKVGFAKALTLTQKMDTACKDACNSQKCCESGSGVDFGDPSHFVIEITL